MPELPEVETVVRSLVGIVVGRRVKRVSHVRSDMVEPADAAFASFLKGRTITGLVRRAKRIVFTLDNGCRFFIHLGMTGQLTVESPKTPLKVHTHLIVDLDDGRQVRFVDPRRFGQIVWMGCDTDHQRVGPEPLTLRPAQLSKLLARTRRSIKTALLDQALIAGIGNIYADEALHRAGIHPLTPADTLKPKQVEALNRAIKQVLRRAITAGGSSVRDYVDGAGKKGSFQQRHRVYDREGKPCASCKTAIVRIVVGGRSTHFCPKCQKPGKR